MTLPAAHTGVGAELVDAFVAEHRDQPATAERRFVRPVPAKTNVDIVLEWLAANGLTEAMPERFNVRFGDDGMMVIDRFRWKAGPRDTLDNVARRDGVEVVEPTYRRVVAPASPAVVEAMNECGIRVWNFNGPCTMPDDDEPYVAAVPGGRPAMRKRHADLHDLWLTPNGIVEWLPERATFVVAAGQITYEAFRWRTRGFDPGQMVLRRELEPFLDADKGAEVAREHRIVPLVAPLTDQVRALFAASELTLTEVK